MQKFQGQESNLHHSSDNAISLTRWATGELLCHAFISALSFHALILTKSIQFADRERVIAKPKVTEVVSPKLRSQLGILWKASCFVQWSKKYITSELLN